MQLAYIEINLNFLSRQETDTLLCSNRRLLKTNIVVCGSSNDSAVIVAATNIQVATLCEAEFHTFYLDYLVLSILLPPRNWYSYYSHYADEETDSPRRYITCPKPHTQ